MDKSVDQEIVGLLYAGVVAMLLLAAALVAFFLIYQKKLIGQQLALQTMQSAYHKELLVASIQAEEQERQRIGNDLHDGMGSALSAAKMLMGQLAPAVAGHPQGQEVVALIDDILHHSVQDLRHISQSLHPAVLTRFGLAKALHNLGVVCAGAFAGGIDVQVDMAIALTQAQELALYRMVQEAVNNAMKYAQASRLTVQLRQLPATLALTVTDDGHGFDYATAQLSEKAGLGLKSLAARASMLDAVLRLDSAPGRGTCVCVEIPLAKLSS
ncbi:sensor histidine kinase [Hymenobacter sp. M29]|uniref:histidine kinase n=1 Tax=Hymenobacter mellowenesis TaxID=3063995 RepID=A0ABT9AF41_9BACT|nr:sensor histidine kinase [Hymenobacter sp. M29]MDO7847984.1 sensor histidine kinase [Hymenobacter sp. M29]